ncbi:L-asparaginase 1 [Bacteroidia bacterium]|nr:L-asparaginase 1 [Bacteroidia bacterium]
MNKILLIYTGGTIGMTHDAKTGSLIPFNLDVLLETIPSIKKLNVGIGTYSFQHIIDSSDMNPQYWIDIATVIENNYDDYDGFVVLHGTDTMAYTASALSFMLEGLTKPVILTGSQLPIGVLRSDGKDNLINSIEIAGNKNRNGKALVPEVCICFENSLYRGNRCTKLNAENFNAFYSGNYPLLAEIGIHVKYNTNYILQNNNASKSVSSQNIETNATTEAIKKPLVHKKLDENVTILKIHPGMSQRIIENVLNFKDLKGLVLETYGSGNAPSFVWLKNALKSAIERGLIVQNITQCKAGGVEMGKYATSIELLEAGVISGYDLTTESAVCKMMTLLATDKSKDEIKRLLQTSLCGEMTINDSIVE